MQSKQFSLYIGIAVISAVLLGSVLNVLDQHLASSSHWSVFIENIQATLQFVGKLFLNALKMIVVPLIVASLICGVSSMGNGASIGRLGIKTMSFYLLSSTVAILLGLLFVNLMTPGEIDGEPAKDQLSLSSSEVVAETLEKVEGRGTQDILDVFLRMLPPNIVKAAADGQMLGLIVFSLLFGYFILKLEAPLRKNMAEFWQAIFEIMMKMTLLIMKFSPIGIFALIANEVASTGLSAFSIMLKFFVTVALALATHIFVVMPFVLKFVAGVKPIKHYRAMIPAMTTAFSTASSAGTLPVTLECIEKKAGISNKTSSFVLPLGATINMDGTALYECVAALFIAQAYGMDLDLVTQFRSGV